MEGLFMFINRKEEYERTRNIPTVIQMYLPINSFNPEVIMKSGQVFRMIKDEENFRYYAYSGDKAISFRNTHGDFWNFYTSLNDWESFWIEYFDLPTNYSKFNTKIRKSKDKFLQNSLLLSSGMRILKQDLWETLISFIISQQNSIPKITKTINILCERFGTLDYFQTDSVGTLKNYYKFPTPGQISILSLSELQSGTMLGYRAEYILKIAQDVQNERFELNKLYSLNCEDAIKKLQTIKGVGPKVANCVSLYGLHLMESYPIDTWMEKIISEDYSQYSSKDYMKYINSKYTGFQGYIQQIQFYFKRNF